MSKYIIDTKEYGFSVESVILYGRNVLNEQAACATSVLGLEKLNSDYINEHFGDLQDTAYQRGFEDAWNVARKIAVETDDGGVSISALYEMFGTESMCMIMKNNTVYDAADKLKAYEEKQKADDEIKVGDEVADEDGDKTIVTNIHGDLFDGLCSDGSTMMDLFLDDNRKTGRHFDIQSILEDMKHD